MRLRIGTIFRDSFPLDFCNEKYVNSQKLIASIKILQKYIWQTSLYMFCIKLTEETNIVGFFF